MLNKMQHYFTKIIENPTTKAFFSATCTILSTLLGQYNETVGILFILIGADLLTGVIKSFRVEMRQNDLTFLQSIKLGFIAIESRALREGLSKVIEYSAAIFIAHMVAVQFNVPNARQFVIFWISFTELKSIIENLEDMKIEMPGCITYLMEKVGEKIGRDEDE